MLQPLLFSSTLVIERSLAGERISRVSYQPVGQCSLASGRHQGNLSQLRLHLGCPLFLGSCKCSLGFQAMSFHHPGMQPLCLEFEGLLARLQFSVGLEFGPLQGRRSRRSRVVSSLTNKVQLRLLLVRGSHG